MLFGSSGPLSQNATLSRRIPFCDGSECGTRLSSTAIFRHGRRRPPFSDRIKGTQFLVCRAEKAESETETDAQRAVREAQEELAELRREALPRQSAPKKTRKRKADSPDWISSQLTRRFGLAGGLAWLGFLTFGVVSEQIKTRLENASEERGTKDLKDAPEVSLGDGLKYQDIRQGGGQAVGQGLLVVLHYRAYANSDPVPFEDTKKRGKPIVFLYGSRPFTAGLCLGVEKALRGMKAGGIRKVTVPPSLGFGEKGISLRGTGHAPGKEAQADVPADATLHYELEIDRVSIAPS